jgi:hypothetical protein
MAMPLALCGCLEPTRIHAEHWTGDWQIDPDTGLRLVIETRSDNLSWSRKDNYRRAKLAIIRDGDKAEEFEIYHDDKKDDFIVSDLAFLEIRGSSDRRQIWLINLSQGRVVASLDRTRHAATGPRDAQPVWARLDQGDIIPPPKGYNVTATRHVRPSTRPSIMP